MRATGVALCAFAALAVAPTAAADDRWLPHPDDATWTYQWTDTAYATTPTTEKVTVKSQKGSSFVLAWTTADLDNPDDAVSSSGTVSFQQMTAGIENVDWSSSAPPATFPLLCPQRTNCGNALSSTYYDVIWGSRHPVLAEPLIQGFSWSSTGGAADDVTSTSTYLGMQKVTVPAFPTAQTAAVVRSLITQAGALGDPYGSGTRTVWWVAGVGPVKVEFDHAGGAGAPVTTSVLQSTNQVPLPAQNDLDYLPFKKGASLTYSWTNTKHLPKPEVEKFTVDAVVNRTARFRVKNVSGPIKVAGSYGFTVSLDGITNLWGNTSSSTLQKFPPLGPASAAPAKRNHFVTPFDLMTFGFNPVIDADPAVGDQWASVKSGNDYSTYGVTGQTKIVGTAKVTVAAGTFDALVLRSTLAQPGFPYGSGTRTSWFAPGKGLVKLVFDHGDGSVSTVELVK